MKRKLLKVGAITLIVVLAIYLIIMGTAILLFPKKTAKMFSDLGNYKVACKLYEIEYHRKPSVNNLQKVIDYSIIVKNDKKVVTYGKKLLANDEYKAEYQDEYYLNFTLSYIKSYYVTGQENSVETALELAIEYKEGNPEYCAEYSAISVLSANCYKNKDKTTLLSLSEKLQEIVADDTGKEEQKSFYMTINKELNKVNNFLSRLS